MAIALFTGLLVAATAVLIQMSQAWAEQADDPILDRHADGLERFIRRTFSESGPTGVRAPTTDQISTFGALLSVTPPADLPWTDLQAEAGGAITAQFCLPEKNPGLWLYWSTSRETTLSSVQPHRILLSPWVTSAQVYIYDTQGSQWVAVDPETPVDNVGGVGTATAYRVLRVVVSRGARTRTLEIPLPKNAS